MDRRRFAFWLSFGMFTLSQKLRVYGLDELAAAMLGGGKDLPVDPDAVGPAPIHWRAVDNDLWQWYERETFINGRWTLSGITVPLNKETGLRQAGAQGYLDDDQVPANMRRGYELVMERGEQDVAADGARHEPDADARARHGRPPSKWLRSLNADELRIWLRTIDVPEAGVSGMTTWVHLTRDHSFEPENIEGLAEDEQSKLHAAAHYGY